MIEIGPRSKTQMTYDEARLCLFVFTHNGKKNWRFPTESEYYFDDTCKQIFTSWYDTRPYHDDDVWYLTPVRDVRYAYIPRTHRLSKSILFGIHTRH